MEHIRLWCRIIICTLTVRLMKTCTTPSAAALALASGDVVVLLNSDDRLKPDALQKASAAFAANPNADMISGGVDVVRDLGGTEQLFERHNTASNKNLDRLDLALGVPVIKARFLR